MLEQQVELSIHFPPGHPCLAGHFPGNPIIPAVVLLQLAAEAVQELIGKQHQLGHVQAAKFLHPMHPGDAITLGLSVDHKGCRARFRYKLAGQPAAHGDLLFTTCNDGH